MNCHWEFSAAWCPVSFRGVWKSFLPIGTRSRVNGAKRSCRRIDQAIRRFVFLVEDFTMLTHLVIWKYRNDIEQVVREEHVRLLKNLASVIKEVTSLNVGFDLLHLPRSYDTGLVATFRDRAALDAYTVHPEHVMVADFGRKISEHVASVDFEE
jgi:hypothetical protein